MAETASVEEEPEFKWGRLKCHGGKSRKVKFFESFTYDGVHYNLYDSVYLFKEGEPEPYIGKIIKIWENFDNIKSKRVKILWYFRPCEIANFLEESDLLDKELFLACGDGLGLSNINPLEAIAGKCNVVCISRDKRNPQPSDEEVQLAEFVFYRFFDVGQKKVLDKIDDKIAGIEVKNIFNSLDSKKPFGIGKLALDKKEISASATEKNNMVANNEPMIDISKGKCFNTLVMDIDDSTPSLGEKINIGVKEEIKPKVVLSTIGDDTGIRQCEVEENGVLKDSYVSQRSSTKLSPDSETGIGIREVAIVDDRSDNASNEKTISWSKADWEKGECKVVKDLAEKNKNGSVDGISSQAEKPYVPSEVLKKKIKSNMLNQRLASNDGDEKTIALCSSKENYKLQRVRDSCGFDDGPSKKLKIDKKLPKFPSDKFNKEPSTISTKKGTKLDGNSTEVTPRPNVDRSKWFKEIPWEEKIKNAQERGRLVLLENLDPSLTSEEVQDVILHGFKEKCTAHVIQKTAFASPHSGQAFVIFNSKETAEMVVRKLDKDCLLMSNGRPLVGSIGHLRVPEKKPLFYGHHFLDQLRVQQKDAVSTSHCSQPNNIEYDMAVEWCLLQERFDKSWRKLYEQQGKELRKLKAKLNTKI